MGLQLTARQDMSALDFRLQTKAGFPAFGSFLQWSLLTCNFRTECFLEHQGVSLACENLPHIKGVHYAEVDLTFRGC